MIVAFLIVKSKWRTIIPIPTVPFISPNTSNQNFEINNLFSVVEKFRNYVFEDDIPHRPQGMGRKLCSEGI